jgi:type VI protein secretion system component Hcp
MAKEDHTDLFMIFVNLDGSPVPAESRTDLSSADATSKELLKGFDPGKMFEVEKFTLSASGDGGGSTRAATEKTLKSIGGRVDHIAVKNMQALQPVKKQDDAPPVQPVKFTRSIDAASLAMMQNLIDCKGYQSASLVKRKAAGGKSAGEVFLRIDFNDVLVKELEWSDDDEVTEDCTFICRSVTISYRPQLPDGSLGAVIPGKWPAPKQTS